MLPVADDEAPVDDDEGVRSQPSHSVERHTTHRTFTRDGTASVPRDHVEGELQIPAQGDEPVFGLTYGCVVRRLDEGRMVPRTAVAERIAAVVGAGGVVVVAAEAGTGKRVLAHQALERLAGVDVAIHDADRCDADGLVALGQTLATRATGAGAIVVARHDPGLCLRELGETGPVLELDGQDLAWSEAEVAEGLERWGIRGDAEHLVSVTEGWCAAVRLGAFVGEHALAPASAPLADYLFADALRGVPPEHRDALLRLSFADAFDAADVASIVGTTSTASRRWPR